MSNSAAIGKERKGKERKGKEVCWNGGENMSITMYNCGFGDCFCVEDEYVKRPLYVDFGIHRNSLVGNKIARYNVIANEMM